MENCAVIGLDREGRRVLAAVVYEADMAGIDVGSGERGGGDPDDASGRGLERAMADVRDDKAKARAVRISDVDVRRSQHQRAAFRDRKPRVRNQRRVIDVGETDAAPK